MIISEDKSDADYQIKAHAEGSVRVNDTEHASSLIISAHTLITNWPVVNTRQLQEAHWQPILELAPDVLLLGTGREFAHVPPVVLAPLYAAGVGVECMNTAAACRTYMAMLSEGRNVVAALIVG